MRSSSVITLCSQRPGRWLDKGAASATCVMSGTKPINFGRTVFIDRTVFVMSPTSRENQLHPAPVTFTDESIAQKYPGSFVVHEVWVHDESADEYRSVCPRSLSEGKSCSTHLSKRAATAYSEAGAGTQEKSPAGFELTENPQNEVEEAIWSAIRSASCSSSQPAATGKSSSLQ